MICLGPVCIPAAPFILLMLKPLWMILPDSLKTWLQSVWNRLWSFVFGKAKKDSHVSSDDVITDATWSSIEAAPVAIIDFGATWCGPCRRISPVFHDLATEFKGKATFYSIDTDDYQELSVEKGVGSIPAFHVYKLGKLDDQLIGADQDKLRALVVSACK